MTLEFETMTPGGRFGDTCETVVLDLRPHVNDGVLASIPRFIGRWEDGHQTQVLLDENDSEAAAADNCDFVTFSSELQECTVIIPDQTRIAAGFENVDYRKTMEEFCKAKGLRRFPTLFDSSGNFAPADSIVGEKFLRYLTSDLRRRYMRKMRTEAWNGDQANANEIHGILTQIDAGGPIAAGDECELYNVVDLNWSTLTGTGGSTPTKPDATIAAASDTITLHGVDFTGNEGLNMVEFLVLWLERLMEHDLAAWEDEEVVFELWTGRGQTTCIANLAACMQPCDGCVNPLSDPQIRDRASDFRRNKRIWLYPYDNVSIDIKTSAELQDQMILVPKSIGGAPLIAWVFRDQAQQISILNGEIPFYGAESGLPDPTNVYPLDEFDAVANFEQSVFGVNCERNGNCIDYWINSESALVLQGFHLWLRFTQVSCDGLIPDVLYDMGIAATACNDPGGNNIELTVPALEVYGTVGVGDTYAVYGEDGLTVAIGIVVSYVEGTDVLTLNMGADLACTYGGGLDAAVVVKHQEN